MGALRQLDRGLNYPHPHDSGSQTAEGRDRPRVFWSVLVQHEAECGPVSESGQISLDGGFNESYDLKM
jgi:hypothetical protein